MTVQHPPKPKPRMVWATPEAAHKLAALAHAGQEDKSGQPFIDHPSRIAAAMPTDELKIIALLHDTLEDTTLSREVLWDSFGGDVYDAVEAMTRREGEQYFDYIRRVKENPMARLVKVVDIADNLRPGGPPGLQERYLKALSMLVSLD